VVDSIEADSLHGEGVSAMLEGLWMRLEVWLRHEDGGQDAN
jgi:hypothetical protein